jgi:carboxymethylenebutenolidase
MNQKIIDLYDDYTHARIDRRAFLGHLAQIAGGTAAAYALLPLLANDYAEAASIAADDARLVTERVTLTGATGAVKCYLARPADAKPKGKQRYPGVVVIHENRGLNPHIEDVARRAALAGFIALAPDALSPFGGTPPDEDKARELFGKLDAANTRGDFVAAVDWLGAMEACSGKVGAVGFCWGGGMVGQLAVHSRALDAGVVFYGRQPATEEVAKITAPLLLNYAGLDARINEGIGAFQRALDLAGVRHDLYLYPGANHAFHNDSNATRYSQPAAELAWQRTVDFLKRELGG